MSIQCKIKKTYEDLFSDESHYLESHHLPNQRVLEIILGNCRSINTNDRISILDFGSGNGRYIVGIIKGLNEMGIKSHITSYDIFNNPPQILESLKSASLNISSETYKFNGLKTINVEGHKISFINGKSNFLSSSERDQLSKAPKFNIITNIYGPISHIKGSKNRIDTLKTIREISDKNSLLISTLINSNKSSYLKPGDREINFFKNVAIPPEYKKSLTLELSEYITTSGSESSRIANIGTILNTYIPIIGNTYDLGHLENLIKHDKVFLHIHSLESINYEMQQAGWNTNSIIQAAMIRNEKSITRRTVESINLASQDASEARSLQKREDIIEKARDIVVFGTSNDLALEPILEPEMAYISRKICLEIAHSNLSIIQPKTCIIHQETSGREKINQI